MILCLLLQNCRPGQDRQPLFPTGGLPFNFPVVMSMQVDGQSITAGEVREGQASLRQKVREDDVDMPGQGWFHKVVLVGACVSSVNSVCRNPKPEMLNPKPQTLNRVCVSMQL